MREKVGFPIAVGVEKMFYEFHRPHAAAPGVGQPMPSYLLRRSAISSDRVIAKNVASAIVGVQNVAVIKAAVFDRKIGSCEMIAVHPGYVSVAAGVSLPRFPVVDGEIVCHRAGRRFVIGVIGDALHGAVNPEAHAAVVGQEVIVIHAN